MCSVEIAGRTKMKRLWKYPRRSVFTETELKNVSAHSGCLWSIRSPMKWSFTCSHSASPPSPSSPAKPYSRSMLSAVSCTRRS